MQYILERNYENFPFFVLWKNFNSWVGLVFFFLTQRPRLLNIIKWVQNIHEWDFYISPLEHMTT